MLAGTEGASNSGIDMAVTGGRAHLVWMQDRKDEKTRIIKLKIEEILGTSISSSRPTQTF